MKTKSFLLLLAGASVMFFSSCKKDNSQKFSTLSVEENKASIEENAIAMLDEVKVMEKGPTIDATGNMIDYMNLGPVFDNNPNMNTPAKVSKFNEFLKPIMIAKNLNKFDAKRVANELKPNLKAAETLTELWNNAKGTYTWIPADSTWSYTAGDEIRIEFPSVAAGTTNNAVFRVYSFQSEAGPFTWWTDYAGGEYTGDLPKQIKSELKVDQDVILSYTLNITYENADKKPNLFSTTLELTPFKFSLEASNRADVNGSVIFSLTKSSKTLLLLSLSAKGDWSYDYLTNPDGQEIGSVINSGNAIFQLINIKVIGNVDVITLESKLADLDATTEIYDSAYVAAECDIINKYSNLSVCYVDNNQIIAKAVAYSSLYYESVYNDVTQQYEDVASYQIGQRFIFGDDSTIDIKTYFQEGFDTLVQDFQDYLDELRTNYFK